MAARKRTKSRSSGAWFGLILGMVLGVGAAVAVALFVTQVPMPFADKASRNAPQTLLPDVGNAPDPNIGLYGKDGAAGTLTGQASTAPSGILATEPPVDAPKNPLADDIGKLIANLSSPKAEAPVTPAAPAAPKAPAPGTQTIYYLQTGAFRSRNDAEAMNARVLMLGLPVRIEQTQSNGTTLNRVRVGPFKGIDEMNQARAKLGTEQIESSVVRP
ncbi:SPOR domain-containing protein [Alcaligenaceae bacterium CGII-47]|nr:SPOR domain-containing protein [Alcaligenaceae bacterium CGII-47]